MISYMNLSITFGCVVLAITLAGQAMLYSRNFYHHPITIIIGDLGRALERVVFWKPEQRLADEHRLLYQIGAKLLSTIDYSAL